MSDFDDKFFARMRDVLADKFNWFGMDEENTPECLRLAFEEAHSPPKPDEPTGLGAVVEDADGRKWVRADEVTEDDFIIWHATKASGLDWRDWSEIDAVRVLSEGVQP